MMDLTMFRSGLFSLLMGIGLCVVLTLWWGYQNGAYNFNDYPFSGGSKAAFRSALKKIQNPVAADWKRIGFLGIGSGIMGLLVFLRYCFTGWPLHPIGFTYPLVYPTRNSVLSLFLAWGIKSIVIRIGGVTLYTRTRPFLVGLAAGYPIGVALTFFVDWIWFFGQGHRIHSW